MHVCFHCAVQFGESRKPATLTGSFCAAAPSRERHKESYSQVFAGKRLVQEFGDSVLKPPLDSRSAGGSMAAVVSYGQHPHRRKNPKRLIFGCLADGPQWGLWRLREAPGSAAPPVPATCHHTPEVSRRAQEGAGSERRRCQKVTLKEGLSHPKPPCSRSWYHSLSPGPHRGHKECLTTAATPPQAHTTPPPTPNPHCACRGPSPHSPHYRDGSPPPAWGRLFPGRPPPPQPHIPQALQWDPNGASRGLPQHSRLSRLRSEPPTRCPLPSEIVGTLQAHTPLRWEWNSLKHPGTLREPAPASSTSPALRGVCAAQAPPRGRMV